MKKICLLSLCFMMCISMIHAKNKKETPSISKREIALAVKKVDTYLWNNLKKNYSKADLINKINANVKGGRNWTYGEVTLSLYALFRSSLKPNMPEVDKYLNDFLDVGDEVMGFNNMQTLNPKTRPVYLCALMVLLTESVLIKFNDSESESVKAVSTAYRGKEETVKRLLDLSKRCIDYLTTQGRGHVWDYDGKRGVGWPPHYSTSQYTVLAFRSAISLNIKIPKNVWQDIHVGVVKDFIKPKKKKKTKFKFKMKGGVLDKVKYNFAPTGIGGWTYRYIDGKPSPIYTQDTNPSFNMTCVGLGNLALAYHFHKKGYDKKMKQTMANGLLYLEKLMPYYIENVNYYNYYSFERVAVFYGITHFGKTDWHNVMCAKIVAEQKEDGSFDYVERKAPAGVKSIDAKDFSLEGKLLPSAYALLFLRKATKPLRY